MAYPLAWEIRVVMLNLELQSFFQSSNHFHVKMREITYRQTDKEDLHHFQGNLFSVLTFSVLFSVLNSIKTPLIKFPQASLSEAVQNIHGFGHKVDFIHLVKTTKKVRRVSGIT